jgi:hypothetical protein
MGNVVFVNMRVSAASPHPAVFKCPKCPRTFEHATSLGIHLRLIHKVPGKSKTALRYHQDKETAKSIASSPSPQEFARMTTAAKRNSPQSFKCPECPKTFAAKTGLGSHMRTHGITGQSKSALDYHAKKNGVAPATTVAGPPFQCEHCTNSFRTHPALASHMRIVHGVPGKFLRELDKKKTGELPAATSATVAPTPSPSGPPFICPECKDDSFGSAAHLGRHRRWKHGIIGRFTKEKVAALEAEAPRKRGRPAGSGKNVDDTQSTQLQPVERVLHHHEQKHVNSNNGHEASAAIYDPLAYALTIGGLKEFCRRAAEEHGIPTREFTRQCAELFLREARR